MNIIVTLQNSNIQKIQKKIDFETYNIDQWCAKNKLTLNKEKSSCMIVARHEVNLPNRLSIKVVTNTKTLGVILDNNLSWASHSSYICTKANQRLQILRRLKNVLSQEDLHDVYVHLVRSVLEYACPTFVGLNRPLSSKLQKVDNRAHRILYNTFYGSKNVRKCVCSKDMLANRRFDISQRLFSRIAKVPDHILKANLPAKSRLRDRFVISYFRTNARGHSFIPYMSRIENRSV